MSYSRVVRPFLVAVFFAAICPVDVHAAFQMRITSYSAAMIKNGEIIVGDRDEDPSNCAIKVAANLGNFSFQVGASSGFGVDSLSRRMGLDQVVVTHGSSGFLLIELTETDWLSCSQGTLHGNANASFSDKTGVTINAFASKRNVEFDNQNITAELCSGTKFGTSSFAGTCSQPANDDGYAMTMTVLLAFRGADSGDVKFEVKSFSNPEPATAVSAVMALPIVGSYLLRRRKLLKALSN